MTSRMIAKILIIVFSLNLAAPLNVVQAGIPTIDVANILQTTTTAIENIQQVVQLYQQIDNQVKQIERQVSAFENMNGNYFKHMLLNDYEYKKARRWVPKTYAKVLDLYKNIDTAGYETTVDSGWKAADDLYIIEDSAFFEDNTTNGVRRWSQHKNDNMAGVGLAESSYGRVDELIEETEALIDDIEGSEDAKAAQDLANRLAAQNQLLIAELIRLNASQAATHSRNALHQQAMMAEDKKRATFEEMPKLFIEL